VPSGFLALAERLSGRQTSSVCVNGMLVDMERVKMPLPDGPPPQTPLTKRAKLSGQIAAQMERHPPGNRMAVRTGCMLSDYVIFRRGGRGTGRFHVGAKWQ